MIKIYKINVFLILFFLIQPVISYAFNGFSNFNEIMEKVEEFNGKNIIITGEAIGRTDSVGGDTRIDISDGKLNMAVWIDREDADKIKLFGAKGQKGDTIEVEGFLNKSCTRHEGSMDIHAYSIRIIDSGYYFRENVDKLRIYMAGVLSILTIVTGGLYLKYRG